MNQEQKEYKELLEQQLQNTKEQIQILDEMDFKLHEMKKIAEYAAGDGLSPEERSNSNKQIEQLKKEVDSLETLRYANYH
ncbi:hypothetical protein [Planomicrobium sp. CPCC 101079]|uniref:hypothetical protein n=1 Tax=Planomicrobium sp. CPCC 101079 TaxID=2599618 RepID=UPI0011B79DD3|nr:hypothetical protein [Planomicrobium sp. CPCC 101079]TWT03671.1 hypothetical protein FQV28_11675 [Planomicrobium sp. CPCC 101079]